MGGLTTEGTAATRTQKQRRRDAGTSTIWEKQADPAGASKQNQARDTWTPAQETLLDLDFQN